MDPSLGFALLALLTLLASALTAVEVAIASLGRIRIAALLREHPRYRHLIHALLDSPRPVMAAVALLTNVTVALAGVVAGFLAAWYFSGWSLWAQGGFAVGIVALYFFVLGEFVPKYLGRELVGRWMLGLLRPLYWLIRPLIPAVNASHWLIGSLRQLIPLRSASRDGEMAPVNEDQIKFLLQHLLDEAEAHGLVGEDEERMIWRILTYDDLVVRQVMVPRPEVVSISAETPAGEVREIIAREGHSRYPVYEGTHDNIVGILHAKDLLRTVDCEEQSSVTELQRPPYFTPTVKPINDLLREFQLNKRHMAIVVDEFGSMAGIVTLEDILEEIVGEISDEYDEPRQLIRQLSPNEYLIDGDAELSMLNEELGLDLPIDGAVTIGGLVTERLEEIPRPGRSVTTDGVTLVVESATAREVLKVRLKFPQGSAAEGLLGRSHAEAGESQSSHPQTPG